MLVKQCPKIRNKMSPVKSNLLRSIFSQTDILCLNYYLHIYSQNSNAKYILISNNANFIYDCR